MVHLQLSRYPRILYDFSSKSEWDAAIRLCRFVKDRVLWACLAGMSLHAHELNTAEVALAAINEVDKLQFILHVKEIPTVEGRSAELALYSRRTVEAETILLQAGLIYRAIKLNIRLFNWDRALDLAVKHKTHVDTVLAYRARYLENFGREDTDPRFVALQAEVPIDWEQIKAKIEVEKEKERARPGARPYV